MASQLDVGSLVTTGDVGIGAAPTNPDGNSSALSVKGGAAAAGAAIYVGNTANENSMRLSNWNGNCFVAARGAAKTLHLGTQNGAVGLTIGSTGLATFSNDVSSPSLTVGDSFAIASAGGTALIDNDTSATISIGTGGTVSITNDGAALILFYLNGTGPGALFYADWSGTTVKLADPNSFWGATSGATTNHKFYKSINSTTSTLQNNTVSTQTYRVTIIRNAS